MDEHFLKESLKSYQKCHVSNSARRNSLLKKTTSFERQRKLTSNDLDKQERQLREQLKNMKIKQTKNSILSDVRGGSTALSGSTSSPKKSDTKNSTSFTLNRTTTDFVEPYPVTFGGHITATVMRQRSFTTNGMEAECLKYAARRGRRVSKEFEDLNVNTSTGQLVIPSHHRSRLFQSSSGSISRGLDGLLSSLDSSENSHWAGDPEAIHSVRRPRKSVTQQDRERLMRK